MSSSTLLSSATAISLFHQSMRRFVASSKLPYFTQTTPRTHTHRPMATAAALTKPGVGVGVVILRHLKESTEPEVLLIRRGKPPSLGMWSFCGGSLELGETLVACAVREAKEETGLTLRQNSRISPTVIMAKDLSHPVVFTAVDVIDRDPTSDALRFHYAVVEVAALPEDPRAPAEAADDADECWWFAVGKLRSLENLVPRAVEVVDEALARFSLTPE